MGERRREHEAAGGRDTRPKVAVGMSEKPSKNGPSTVNSWAKGRFQPGNKHGKGRPSGSRNKASLAVDKLLDGEAEAITRKAIELALEGDGPALRLCLERVAPPRK